uniref:3-hydroxyacyl-CoA dehydrogenase n=1 Tax=Aureoumbra lagunensis TaxID=44058 RepID=A0A6S8E358_9STRA|mmetsp:Transcript_13171/g.17586  ORF Transcript_13171/g.17586 Transcript_13171/m.17586 type:complete len:236 (+) Transcript_13171:49-756(+)
MQAIVFGGSSGLGAATARALSERFAKVLIADKKVVERKENTEFVECNVCSEKDVSKAFDRVPDANVAINCAGIGFARKVFSKKHGTHPLEDFERVLRVNVLGSFNVARLASERFVQRNTNGLIINTASIAAFEGQRGQVAYAASKGAVAAMTLPLARDLAEHSIRVVTIAPGLFRTPLLEALPESVQTDLANSILFPSRLGLPEEFAKLVLAIIDNDYINGTVIRLDGALRMPSG